MDLPEILYVTEEPKYDYSSNAPLILQLVGSEHVESRIPLDRITVVGVYKLVRLETYKKTETTEVAG